MTVADLVRARRGDERIGLIFEDQRWTWDQWVQGCIQRAALIRDLAPPGRPLHIGVLLDNTPDFSMLLGGAALAGATVVGLNPTRRDSELARDITVTDCSMIVTERKYWELFDDLDVPVAADDRYMVDSYEWTALLSARVDAEDPLVPLSGDDLFMLIFTSGTSGNPKVVRCTHTKITQPGTAVINLLDLTTADIAYLSMPLFHSAGVMAGWSTTLTLGSTVVLKRRFSASEFLPDVRHYGATWFHYIGKPLAYILATPPQPDDADNPLRVAIGNEGTFADVSDFERRFGVSIIDGYGSTESGINLVRNSETPLNSLGAMPEGVAVIHLDTGEPCPPAEFDADGRLLNAEAAIGELVNLEGPGNFVGYYGNPEADKERVVDGRFRSGDLAYVDRNGFAYFAGRTQDWMRVDGENIATEPIERLIQRHPSVMLVSVYAVPNATVGDDVMAAIVLHEGAATDVDELVTFIRAQRDLGTKWLPRYIRLAGTLPQTSTNKVLKRVLARERWECDDPVWFRPGRDDFRPLGPGDAAALRDQFASRSREHVLL
ncbi:MAG: acyl-CoA synthetase [Actinomycetia bacterium]|nr:acyl-CoA synthetase [Actinomycetes bacterium]